MWHQVLKNKIYNHDTVPDDHDTVSDNEDVLMEDQKALPKSNNISYYDGHNNSNKHAITVQWIWLLKFVVSYYNNQNIVFLSVCLPSGYTNKSD